MTACCIVKKVITDLVVSEQWALSRPGRRHMINPCGQITIFRFTGHLLYGRSVISLCKLSLMPSLRIRDVPFVSEVSLKCRVSERKPNLMKKSTSTPCLFRKCSIKSTRHTWHSIFDLKCINSLNQGQLEHGRIAVPCIEESNPLCLDDELPPPKYYTRSNDSGHDALDRSSEQQSLPTAVLSLIKPHKILSVSKEMCDITGFAADEMIGRSFNLIHGPKTDMRILNAAIKNAGLRLASQFSTSMYASDGSEMQISASCVPDVAEGDVLLGFKFQLIQNGTSVVKVLPYSDETVEGLAELMAHGKHSRRNSYRVQYNFRTGLAIQHSMLRRPLGARPSPHSAHTGKEDVFLALGNYLTTHRHH